MSFFGKSLIRKLFLYLVFFLVFLFGLFYLLGDSGAIDVKYVLTGAFALIILFFMVLYFDIIKPLRGVMFQMQALLSGKTYKKVYTERTDEVGVIAHFFNQVTKGFSRVSSELKERDRMVDELSVASQLQRDILPLASPDIKGLHISAKNRPATELGGDSFNIFTKKDNTYIYIGDVTGHGVSAGLIMTMVNSLLSVFSDLHDSAFEVLVKVNCYIKRHVKKAMFMTMVLLCWNQKTQKMTFVGAGHEHILVYRADSGKCEAIMSGGVALGMVPDNSKLIKEVELPLAEGDFIVLFSDGITEARNPAGELYDLKRLMDAVKEFAPQYSADGVNYHIAQDVVGFMGNAPQGDDMTLIVIKRDSKTDSTQSVKDHSTNWKN